MSTPFTRTHRLAALAAALISAFLLPAITNPALAQLPTYGPLQLRARTITAQYGIPLSTGIDTNYPPRINNSGQVAMALTSGIWFNGHTLNLAGLNPRPHDGVSLNNQGVIAWTGIPSTGAPGIFTYDTASNSGELATNDPGPAYSHSGAAINDSGVLSYYADINGYSGIAQYDPATGPPHMLATSNGTSQAFEAGYHRALDMNNGGQVVARDTRAQGGIVRFNPDGSSVVVPGSFSAVTTDDRVAIDDAGTMAFSRLSFPSTVSRSDGQTLTVIGRPNSPVGPMFTSLIDVPPAIDAQGNVAFLTNGPGVQSQILIGDGRSLVSIAQLGDTVLTDQGLGRITRFYSLDMNEQSDIAFVADLASVQSGNTLGQSLIVIPAVPAPGLIPPVLAAAALWTVPNRRRPGPA